MRSGFLGHQAPRDVLLTRRLELTLSATVLEAMLHRCVKGRRIYFAIKHLLCTGVYMHHDNNIDILVRCCD